jgi:hypothetical protein
LNMHALRAICETLVASPLLQQCFDDEKPTDPYFPQDNASDTLSIVFEVGAQLQAVEIKSPQRWSLKRPSKGPGLARLCCVEPSPTASERSAPRLEPAFKRSTTPVFPLRYPTSCASKPTRCCTIRCSPAAQSTLPLPSRPSAIIPSTTDVDRPRRSKTNRAHQDLTGCRPDQTASRIA